MNKESEAMRKYFYEQLDAEITRFEDAGPEAVKTFEYSRMVRRKFCSTLKSMFFTEAQLDMLAAQKDLLAALESYREKLDYDKEGITPDDIDRITGMYLKERYYEHRLDKLTKRLYDAKNDLEYELRELPAQAIINRAHEISLKNDILMALESYRPPIHEIDTLLTAADPLQAVMEAHDNSYCDFTENLRNCTDVAAEGLLGCLDKKGMDLRSMDVRSYYETYVPAEHLMGHIRARDDIDTYERQFLEKAAAELRAAFLDSDISPDAVMQMGEVFSKLVPIKFSDPLSAVVLLTLNDPLHTLADVMQDDDISIEKAVSQLTYMRKLKLADLAEHRTSLTEQEQQIISTYFTHCYLVIQDRLAARQTSALGMEQAMEDDFDL